MQEYIQTVIALSLVPNIGAMRTRLLLNRVESPSDVFKLSARELLNIQGIGKTVAGNILSFNNWAEVNRIIQKSEQLNVSLLTTDHPAYPTQLLEIYDPPVLLWVLGDIATLSLPGISVIGTRAPSDYGSRMAGQFSAALTEAGFVIISGFAYGIDTIAHKSCLAGKGKTIAVLGSGIDWIYPRSNAFLVDQVLELGGCIISEFPPGTKPDYSNFPVRNRVVSGLAKGVLIIETGEKGGSMITARLALDQNREIFVVPHAVTNKKGIGCNQLIRDSGGKLVAATEDILCEFPGWKNHSETAIPDESAWRLADLNETDKKICEVIELGGRLHIDQIQEKAGRPAPLLLSDLLALEFNGFIRQYAGKMFEIK